VAAVYFCTLEALQNITKYASASRATAGLSCSDGSLQFTVTDDGAGFDTATTRHGTGLQGWPTGWPRSAAPWPAAPSPNTAPP
jgi:signal transduction histidine kinase